MLLILMSSALYKSPLFNALLFALFWALNIFVSKLALLAGENPMVLTIQSLAISLIILILYILPRRFRELKKIKHNILFGILFACGINAGLGGFLSNAGTELTTAINTGFLVRFALITTTFFAWLILKEKITSPQIVMIALLLTGTFLITSNGEAIVPHIGDILLILACVAWSIGNVLIKKILRNSTIDPDTTTLLRPVAAIPTLIFLILLAPLFPTPLKNFFTVNYFEPDHLFWSFLVGITLVLTWQFLNRTLKVASASYMTMMGMLTPVFVTILAMVFLHETMTFIQFFGAALIIFAGVITNFLGIHKH